MNLRHDLLNYKFDYIQNNYIVTKLAKPSYIYNNMGFQYIAY